MTMRNQISPFGRNDNERMSFRGAKRREILKISPCGRNDREDVRNDIEDVRNDIEDVRNDKEEPDFSLRSK